MESLLKQWDGEDVIIRYHRPSGAWILVAIHSTRLGPPASGGTRMRPYPDTRAALQDALKLSAAMTAKIALAGIAHGGGKTVIALPPNFDPAFRADLLRSYGTLLHQLGGLFLTGPDVGTSPEDMNIIAETGAPYVFSRTPEAGGAGDSGPGTAVGVLSAIHVTCEQLFGEDSPAGKRILVQGTGSVGTPLIEMGAVPFNSQGYYRLFLPRIFTNFTNYFYFFVLICVNSWQVIDWEARVSAPN